ncbi:hypothetical protein A2U01_0034129, partial [Trifolium medium]|nr:hypothetical protein [Trifolium medium]
MASGEEDSRLVDTITSPELSWVGPEPRGIASCITPTAVGVFTIVKEDLEEPNWEVHAPDRRERICSRFSDNGFSMYEFVFKELGFRLPFSDF